MGNKNVLELKSSLAVSGSSRVIHTALYNKKKDPCPGKRSPFSLLTLNTPEIRQRESREGLAVLVCRLRRERKCVAP